jgi:HEAT repeat protein
MSDSPKQKDWWDKIASITPLILGLAVTGLATLFTQIYNFHQLQLNQIIALDKLRPLLTSDKPEEREFGYASFAALGYKDVAVQIIKVKQDQSGRPLLNELAKSGSPEIRADAANALKGLDEANRLVNISEFGTPDPSEDLLKQHPELDPAKRAPYAAWSVKAAKDLGMSSKLGTAILFDAAVYLGPNNASKLQEGASRAVAPPLDSQEKETAWLNEYLNLYDSRVQQVFRGSLANLYPGVKKRIDRLRQLIKDGDWNLKTLSKL